MNRRTFVVAAWLVGPATAIVFAQSPYEPYEARPRTESAAPAFLPDTSTAAPLPPTATAVPEPVQQTVALSPPDARPTTKLALPAARDDKSTPSAGGGGIASVLGALAVVLTLFLAAAALLRRGLPKQARLLPAEAVEMLGRLPLPGRQQGHLIRVGNKIALIGFSNGGAEPLVEITDPVEVDRLAGLCRQHDPHSTTTSFRGIVEQFFREKPKAEAGVAPAAEDDDA